MPAFFRYFMVAVRDVSLRTSASQQATMTTTGTASTRSVSSRLSNVRIAPTAIIETAPVAKKHAFSDGALAGSE